MNLVQSNYSMGKSDAPSNSLMSSSDDSYADRWEKYIRTDGTVFYIEYGLPNRVCPDNQQRLSDEVAKRESAKRNSKTKEIRLQIYPGHHTRHPPLSTEAALGIYTLSNCQQLIVSGFTKNYKSLDYKRIRVGDILESVNNVNVSKQNIEYVLSSFSKPVNVVLKFKCFDQIHESKRSSQDTSQQITSFEKFSENFVHMLNLDFETQTCKFYPITLVIMDSCDTRPAATDKMFVYPSEPSNILSTIRGSLLTLISITSSELSSHPLFSSVVANDKLYSVFYVTHGKVLILCCILNDSSASHGVNVIANELMKYLQQFSSRISIPLQERTKIELIHICHVLEYRIIKSVTKNHFEKLFIESELLPLPTEAKTQIYDAISEMNATDYRDWNQRPLLSHRNFFVYGSSLYYKSFLLVSHIPSAYLGKIESFLRLRGIFDLIEEWDVHDLVIWEEIPVIAPESNFFLAIASRNKLLLVVIYQLFGTKTATGGLLRLKSLVNSSFYFIDEMQDTLNHLHQGGIDTLAEKLIGSKRKSSLTEYLRGSTAAVKLNEYLNDKTFSAISPSSLHGCNYSEESNHKGIDDSDSDWDCHADHRKCLIALETLETKHPSFKNVCVIPSSFVPRLMGKDNILLYCIYQDIDNGIVISSCQVAIGSSLSLFRSACQYICEFLQSSQCKTTASYDKCKVNIKMYTCVVEYGVLLSSDIAEDSKYWAIGRFLWCPKRRLFISTGSNILQSAVDIAFRFSSLC